MGTVIRSARLLGIAVAVALTAALLHASTPWQRDHGEASPLAVVSDSRITVTWVFGVEEITSCDPPSTVLRMLQQQYTDRIQVNAIFVGDDRAMAQQFLTGERLRVPLAVLSEAEFERRYRDQSPPFIIARGAADIRILPKASWKSNSDGQQTELEMEIARISGEIPSES